MSPPVSSRTPWPSQPRGDTGPGAAVSAVRRCALLHSFLLTLPQGGGLAPCTSPCSAPRLLHAAIPSFPPAAAQRGPLGSFPRWVWGVEWGNMQEAVLGAQRWVLQGCNLCYFIIARGGRGPHGATAPEEWRSVSICLRCLSARGGPRSGAVPRPPLHRRHLLQPPAGQGAAASGSAWGARNVCKAEIDVSSNYVLAAQPPLWLQRKGAEPAACPLCLSPCPQAAVALLCPHCTMLPSSLCPAHGRRMEEAGVMQPVCPVLRSCSSWSSAITCANYRQRFAGGSCPASTVLLCKDRMGKPGLLSISPFYTGLGTV